jgi:hypothetical protein
MSAQQRTRLAASAIACALAVAGAAGAGATAAREDMPRTRIAASPPPAEPVRWQVARGTITATCRLTLGGSFEAVSDALEGELALASDGRALEGTLRVPLDTFDTGIGLRNTHMREHYLETGKGPDFARAALTQIVLDEPRVATSGGQTAFGATLLLHGVTQDIRGTARISRTGDGARVEATFPVSLSAHGVPEPRYLGIGVRDGIEVRVTATFSPAGGAR